MRKIINIMAIGLGVLVLSACQANKSDDMNKANMSSQMSSEMDMEKEMSDDMKKDDMEKEMSDDMKKDDMGKEMSDDMKKDDMGKEMSDDMKKDDMGKEMSDDMKKDDMGKEMSESMSEFDFSLEDVDGNIHKLSDYKGKKVYIKFWASWCSICLASLPDTEELAGMDKDYEVIAVVAPGFRNEKNKEDFIKWYKSLEYKNLTVLLDENGQTMQKYGVRAYPSAGFIDSEGNLANVRAGHLSKEEIENIINNLK